jgi:hypothetical protein
MIYWQRHFTALILFAQTTNTSEDISTIHRLTCRSLVSIFCSSVNLQMQNQKIKMRERKEKFAHYLVKNN